jgi:peptidoglycan/LPS O-acetylase OafA/YrhL
LPKEIWSGNSTPSTHSHRRGSETTSPDRRPARVAGHFGFHPPCGGYPVSLRNGQRQPPASRFLTQLGETGVALFFIITAFLFWSRVLQRGSNIAWLEFLVSSLYRLCPAYLLMVALLVVAAMSGEPH